MWGTIFVPVQGVAAVLFLIMGSVISFSLPKRTMKSCKVVLAFEFVDKILRCDLFLKKQKRKIGIFVELWLRQPLEI